MTQEEKQLLLKDLCARLPYNIQCDYSGKTVTVQYVYPERGVAYISYYGTTKWESVEVIKPYLRPMSSMTEEEENEYRAINCYEGLFPRNEDALDYVLSHHFDCRRLIEKGLALEAPEGMYKTE